ncbi:MAG TPA: hypothetical protein PKY56_11780 [Candidatus Kapabacteria bacterium]|jgi:hypothetical protein|nr:hypothetical protein [Candidatus Kapabacteria bacterium]
MKRSSNRELMIKLVNQWQASGLTQREFADNNNMSLHQLKYWIYKCGKGSVPKKSGHSFIQLEGLIGTSKICIRYPNGVEVTLPEQSSVSTIKSLINI